MSTPRPSSGPVRGLCRLSQKGSLPVGSAAFSLVELMVAISVLAVLGGLVAQLMGSASKLTSTSKQASDCDTEARYALAQISADLSRRVRRPDVDAFVEKGQGGSGGASGNDRLFLFSETSGYAPDLEPDKRSTVCLVGFRVKQVTVNKTSRFELQRYSRVLPWTGSRENPAMPFVVLSGTPAKPVPETTLSGADGKGGGGSFSNALTERGSEDVYYQTLAENVFRFEVSLLRKADPTTSPPTEAHLLTDDQIPEELSRNGLSNIASVIITMGVIDSRNARRVQPDQLGSALALPDTNARTIRKYPLEEWNAVFSKSIGSLPKPMASGVRLYERVISL